MISIPYNMFCCYQHFQTSDSKSSSPVSCSICLFLHSQGNGYIFVMFEIMVCRRVHKQNGTFRPCHSVTNVSIFLASFFSFRFIFSLCVTSLSSLFALEKCSISVSCEGGRIGGWGEPMRNCPAQLCPSCSCLSNTVSVVHTNWANEEFPLNLWPLSHLRCSLLCRQLVVGRELMRMEDLISFMVCDGQPSWWDFYGKRDFSLPFRIYISMTSSPGTIFPAFRHSSSCQALN